MDGDMSETLSVTIFTGICPSAVDLLSGISLATTVRHYGVSASRMDKARAFGPAYVPMTGLITER